MFQYIVTHGSEWNSPSCRIMMPYARTRLVISPCFTACVQEGVCVRDSVWEWAL